MTAKKIASTIVFHPLLASTLAILLFAISFGISPYSHLVLANIWIVTTGIVCLALINTGSVRNTIAKITRNQNKINECIYDMDEDSQQKLKYNLTAENRKWLASNNITSLEDLSSHLQNQKKSNSTIQILHGLTGALSVGAFIAGSTVQTIALKQAENLRNHPETNHDTSLTNFPASILTSAGYGVMYIAQIIFLVLLTKRYEESKAIKHKVEEKERRLMP